jgi:3-hydroxymyristoyl/3-hydroxydecanoyl-(acyl carrier protein) dehydratase
MNQASVTRTVPSDHPAFDGHFPGRPLLPGVLLLSEVMEAAARQPALAGRMEQCTLSHAKFLAPVCPGSTLTIDLQWDQSGLRFDVRCASKTVAKGQWKW